MRIDKPWGYEIIWAHTNDYVGKVLFIKKSARLSLQHHAQKEESLYLQEGLVIILLEDQNGTLQEHTLTPKQYLHIPSKSKHRIIAQEDSLLFEVSTPHLEDIFRHEDDYGRSNHDQPLDKTHKI